MHKKTKHTLTLLTLAGAMLATGAASAMEADYSAANKAITVSGNNIAGTVAVVIMPYEYTVDSLTTEVINATPNILYKPVAAGGAYSEVIPLTGDMLTDGKYRVSENVQNESIDSVYFILSEADCDNINAASGQAEFKTRFNSVITAAVPQMNSNVKNSLADKVYEAVKASGYTYQSFLDMVALYEGLLNCKYGVIDFATYVEEYAIYLSAEIKSEYTALSDAEKEAANSCVSGIDFTSKDAENILSETILIAKVRSALNATELKQYATAYFTENGITPSYYGNLSDYYKELVFATLFDNRETIANAEDLKSRVEKISAEQKKPTSALTGGGGGSANRSPGMGAPVGTTATGETINVFNDISSHWAKDDITEMHKLEIISGFDDGSFRPDKNVTRAEFVKMLVNALNYGIDGTSSFADVPESAWYYGYVSSAVGKGIVSGISETEFGPDMNITRQDAAVMVYRALNGKVSGGTATVYSDRNEISDYATEAVTELSAAAVLRGADGYFRPQKSITRAEAATLLLRVRKLAAGGEQ